MTQGGSMSLHSTIGVTSLCILAIWLGWIVWCDVRSFRIPDYLSLPLVLAGVCVNSTIGFGTTGALLGAGIGYGSFVLVEIGYRALRQREGLGRGDAKLMAAGGAWCGLAALPLIVTIAASSALLFLALRSIFVGTENASDDYLPFAPFLSAAILVAFAHSLFGGAVG